MHRNMLMFIAASAVFFISLWVALRVAWALARYAYRPVAADMVELPSVSVCIAARNEMHALAQCLDYVLTNSYEKMEVLVLDDSSGDETSRIIQSYAHAGVRFIPGKELPAGWLGKNHAYQTLAEEASGDYVLYLDVDTLLAPTSIHQLVGQLLANKKTMLSVLPRREDAFRASALFSTVRYVWELVLSSRWNPPSASALWLIKRQRLLELDRGLKDYGMSIRPERHIAHALQQNKEYYHLIGTAELGVRYEKHWHSLLATAERLYYPMFGHTPLSVLVGLGILGSLVLPFVLVYIAYQQVQPVVLAIALAAILLHYLWFGYFSVRTMAAKGWLLRIVLWPYIALQELLLYIDSCIRYTTGTVRWKGRAMHAQPTKHDHFAINE